MFLTLPSLESKSFNFITHVSQTEAARFCEHFTTNTINSRKLKGALDVNDDMEFFTDFFDMTDLQNLFKGNAENAIHILNVWVENLALSQVAGTRGARAIYINPETNTFGVGTTVIYNENWATLNFSQPDILKLAEDAFNSLRMYGVYVSPKKDIENKDNDTGPIISWYN